MVKINDLNEQVLDLYRQGQYVEAAQIAKRVQALAMEKFGPDHPNVGTSFHNLAMVYEAQGRHLEVVPLLERAIVIFTKLNGEAPSITGPAVEFFRSIPDKRTQVAKDSRSRQRKKTWPSVAEGGDGRQVAVSREGSVGPDKRPGGLKTAALQRSPGAGEKEMEPPIATSSLPAATPAEAPATPGAAPDEDGGAVAASSAGNAGVGEKPSRHMTATLKKSSESSDAEKQPPIVTSSLPVATAPEVAVSQSSASEGNDDAVAVVPGKNIRADTERGVVSTAALQKSPEPTGTMNRPPVAAPLFPGYSPADGAVTERSVLDEDSREVVALADGNVRVDKKNGGPEIAALQKPPEPSEANKQPPVATISASDVLSDTTPVSGRDAADQAQRKAATLTGETPDRLKVALPRKLPRLQNVAHPETVVASLMPVALPKKAPRRSMKFDLPPLPVLGARTWNEVKPKRKAIARRQRSRSSRLRRLRLRRLRSERLRSGLERPTAVDRPRAVISIRPLIR
ncbi:MAG: tetratricopeptide repeat protein [Hyphomicrobiaceae bacterium]